MSDEMNSSNAQTAESVSQTTSPATETSGSSGLIDMITDESLRSEASLKNFKDVSALAKSYVHLNKRLGSAINIPSEDASDEARADFYKKITGIKGVVKIPDGTNQDELNAFYSKLGRPDAPENYDIKLPADMPPELVNQELLSSFRKTAFDLGLNSKQVDALVQMDLQRQSQYFDQLAKEKEIGSQTLKQMWGQDFENRKAAAQRMIEMYGQKYPDAAKSLLNKHVTEPLVYQMLAELGQIYQERGHIQANGAKFGLTPDEARVKISEIRNNPKHPLNNPRDVGHEAALEQMSKLYSAAYPSKDNH